MRVKVFVIDNNRNEVEKIINSWLDDFKGAYIHYIHSTKNTDVKSFLYIFYDHTDKYGNITGAIRGER